MKKGVFGTFITIVICCVITLLIHVYPYSSSLSAKSIFFGAYYKPFVIAGEWWRMLSCGLVHVEAVHLLMNMMSLWMLGQTLEKVYGTVKYLILLFVSVIGGSVFLFISGGNTVAVGLSGGIYGLFASYIFLVYMGGGFRDPAVRRSLLSTALVNLAINFLPGIAWKAHFGGALTGFLLTPILRDHPSFKEMRRHCMISLAGLVLIGAGGMMKTAKINENEVYLGTDKAVLTMEWNLGVHTHVQHMAENLDALYGVTALKPYFNGGMNYAQTDGRTHLG